MTKRIAPAPPVGIERVAERPAGIDFPFFSHSHWSKHDRWLTHGMTGRAADMSLFGGARSVDVLPRWRALRDALAADIIVHARQTHGSRVLLHRNLPHGMLLGPDADGHATSQPRVLLAVSVADCIPIFMIAPDVPAVAMLHAGWRGVAGGMVERGVETLQSAFGATTSHIMVHFGPAICGECYEVGPEVPLQLQIGAATHVDLRAAAAVRAVAAGVPASHISISTHCTRCGDSAFFSHRAGCAERQIGVIGIRA